MSLFLRSSLLQTLLLLQYFSSGKTLFMGRKKKTEFKDLLALATKESHCIVNDL